MKTSLGLLVSLALLLILTVFGVFYSPLTLLSLTPLVIGLAWAIGELAHSRDWERLGLLAFFICIAWINIAGETPSIFTGRDQGSIAEAAWHLAENHQLTWSNQASQAFFAIYGPGTALNFPGFAYTETGTLITQFPLGYTSWLAAWVEWFGLAGYGMANAFLFVISAWTFFELANLAVRRTLVWIGTFVFGLSFLPIWMLHSTLSEHLALTLFLTLSFSLINLRRYPTSLWWYAITWLSASLFLFTRIEGFILFIIATLLILGTRSIRTELFTSPLKRMIIPTLLLGFIFLRDFFINLPFYTMIGKAVVKNWQELWLVSEGIVSSTSTSSQNLFQIFSSYGMVTFFVLGGLGILLALWKEKRESLIVLVLALPTFIYLIDAHITPDHPWMLRRYFFTLWPTFVFFTLITWHMAENRFAKLRPAHITLGIGLMLFVIQYPSARVAWQMDEYSPLMSVTAKLAERLSGHDLVLVDRLATGDPFRLVAGPLNTIYDKQVVYFFNPEDLKRIDRSQFERVFLLVPEERQAASQSLMSDVPEERETITFPLATVSTKNLFPKIVHTETRAILFQLP